MARLVLLAQGLPGPWGQRQRTILGGMVGGSGVMARVWGGKGDELFSLSLRDHHVFLSKIRAT